MTDPGSFMRDNGRVRTFIAPGKILELFSGWKPIAHWGGLGPGHRHGDGPLERHGRFETVLRWVDG